MKFALKLYRVVSPVTLSVSLAMGSRYAHYQINARIHSNAHMYQPQHYTNPKAAQDRMLHY